MTSLPSRPGLSPSRRHHPTPQDEMSTNCRGTSRFLHTSVQKTPVFEREDSFVLSVPLQEARRRQRDAVEPSLSGPERVVPALRVRPDNHPCPLVVRLDVIDGNILATGRAGSLILAVAVLVELEAAVAVLAGAEGVGLVDLGGVGELAVGLPVGGVSNPLVLSRRIGRGARAPG